MKNSRRFVSKATTNLVRQETLAVISEAAILGLYVLLDCIVSKWVAIVDFYRILDDSVFPLHGKLDICR